MRHDQPGPHLTANYPELGTGPVSTAPYYDPAFFEQDVESIFQTSWLWALRESEIPEPGDYMVKDLPTLKRSLIIVRGRDNKIRAPENVCSHRGARIALSERGCAHRFTCPFHAWTYNTAGALVGVPDVEGYFDLDRAQLGLRDVPCESWEGFVFIHPQDTPDQSLESYLGDWGAAMRGYNFDRRQAIQSTPVQALAYAHASGPTIVGGRFSGQTNLPPGVNPARSSNWSVDVNVVFPNFLVVMSEGMFFIHHMWPLSANRTQYNLKGYCPTAQNAAQRFAQEYAMIELRNTILEDISTMEGIQTSFDAGVIRELHFHDHEVALRHQHPVVTTKVRDAVSRRPTAEQGRWRVNRRTAR